tara:strand:+ start:1249 stop:1530 length:282 start_codon:yes stop_codon:yes gene_type:complete
MFLRKLVSSTLSNLSNSQSRAFSKTPITNDLRPQLKKLFEDQRKNKKPLDIGTALILGTPAVGCFIIYIWKQDTEVLQPIRDLQKKKQEESKQ